MSDAEQSVHEAVRELEARLIAFVRAECSKLKEELCGTEEEPDPDASTITLADVAAGEFDAVGSTHSHSEGAAEANGEDLILDAAPLPEAPSPTKAGGSAKPEYLLSNATDLTEKAETEAPVTVSHVSSHALRLAASSRRESFPEFVLQRAPQWGRRAALIDDGEGGRVVTYRALLADIRIIAAALSACGCTVGTRAAVVMGSEAAFAPTVFALMVHGALAVLCNPDADDGMMEDQIVSSGARVVLTTSQHVEKAAAALASSLRWEAEEAGGDSKRKRRKPRGTVVLVDLNQPEGEGSPAPQGRARRGRGKGAKASPASRGLPESCPRSAPSSHNGSVAASVAAAEYGKGSITVLRGVALQVTRLTACLTPKELARYRRSPGTRHSGVTAHLGLHSLPASTDISPLPAVVVFPTRRNQPGLPLRGVVHTHGSLIGALRALTSADVATESHTLSRDVTAGLLSFASAEGFMLHLCASLRVGAAVLCSPTLRMASLRQAIQRYEVSVLYALPAFLRHVAEGTAPSVVDGKGGMGSGAPAAEAPAGPGTPSGPRPWVGRLVSKLRRVWCCGEPLPRRTATRCRRFFGDSVVLLNAFTTCETMGCSHTGVIAARGRLHPALEDVGALRPGFEVAVDSLPASDCWARIMPRSAAVGRLKVRGPGWARPGVAPRYLVASGQWQPLEGADWADTGDVAIVGPQGRLCVVGRASDALGPGGDGPCPAEVEAQWPLVAGVESMLALPGPPVQRVGDGEGAEVEAGTDSRRWPRGGYALTVAAQRTARSGLSAEDVLVRVAAADERVGDAVCVSAIPRCAHGRPLRWHLRLAMLDRHLCQTGAAARVAARLEASAAEPAGADADGDVATVRAADATVPLEQLEDALAGEGVQLWEGDMGALLRLVGSRDEAGILRVDPVLLRALEEKDLSNGVRLEDMGTLA